MSATTDSRSRVLAALAAGLLFGAGLVISGMTQPAKVIAFLDVTGDWDPSLALVMVGAIGVHLIGYRLAGRRASPLFDVRFHMPTLTELDARLFGGAALFGLGWGLGGYCPGPAIAALGNPSVEVAVFVAAMLGATWLVGAIERSASATETRDPSRTP